MQRSSAHIATNITINALRYALALVFLFSAFVKAVDPMGTVYKMTDYVEAFGWAVHPALIVVGAWLLIGLEYLMGVALMFGYYRRFYLVLTILFLGGMTPLTLLLAITNPVSDCGCFGDALVLTNWQTFGKNLVLLVIAIVVMAHNRRIWRVISERMQWLVFVYAAVSIVVFMIYNIRHLPTWDFRPYHVGIDIAENMTVPEDAPQDEYETLFVLEKDGEQRTFTFDDYPDSTWTFVSRENRLVSKGYVPPITDFHLSSLEGDDMTWDLLEYPGYTFLMVAHDLERTDEGMLDVINDLYDYAMVGEHPFYMLTSSGEEITEKWSENTGAHYPYLQADEILLKTMVRSNPGLIVMNGATIVGKWSAADMPRDAQLEVPMQHNEALMQTPRELNGRRLAALMWMFLPLLILVVIDKTLVKH